MARSRPLLSLLLMMVLYVAATTPPTTAAAAVSQAPGSPQMVECGASAGSDWNLLALLSDMLLGGDDDGDDDVAGSSGGQRADSEEDGDYSWWDLGLFDDSSSEEAAGRGPALPGDVTNNSLPGDAANNSVTRRRRAAPSWSLGGMDVQGGRNWSVRVFDWVLVRRNPSTGQVEVKLNVPGLFSPAGGGEGSGSGGDDVGYVSRGGEATSALSTAGPATPPEGSSNASQPADS